MTSNLGIISKTRIQTRDGIYICMGLWMNSAFDIVAFDFQKYYAEPTPCDTLQIAAPVVRQKIENGSIRVI